MTEKEFWIFLKNALEKGRTPQLSLIRDYSDAELKNSGKFIRGHSLLPKDYDKIPIGKINKMGRLLLNKNTSIQAKEVILMLLAHRPSKKALGILKVYNKQPDEELKFFAALALDECKMWNE